MNRIIALFLSICLMLPMSAFAREESDAVSAPEKGSGFTLSDADREKLDFMQKIGVLSSIGEEDISSNRSITRGELAAVAVSLYGDVYEAYQASEAVYRDVSEEDEAFRAVSLLSELHIVSGYGDGTFHPEKEINLNEAVKIITAVMGYTAVAEADGGFPTGYMNVAAGCGLFKGVETAGANEPLTVSELIPLVFNVLEATPLIKIEYSSGGVSYEKTENETLLSVYFDIYKVKGGIVTGNEFTALLGYKTAGEDHVFIDAYEYLDKGHIADGYLGYKVTFYYKEDSDADELIWLKPDVNCKVTKVFTDDVIAAQTTAYKIAYETSSGARSRFLELKKDVSVIYNGKEYSGFTAELFQNACGDLTAISWGNGSDIDVLIVNDYEYYVVDRVNAANAVISDKFDKRLNLEDDIEDVLIVNEKGEPVLLENLKEWDALAYQKSMDGEYQKLTVVKNHVEGRVEAVRFFKDEASLGAVTIDGVEYEISGQYAKNAVTNPYPVSSLSLSRVGYFVMDMNHKIILIDMNRKTYAYGILQGIEPGEALDKTVSVRIYTSKGEHRTFELAERVLIDSRSIKTKEYASVLDALKKGDVISFVTDAEKREYPDWRERLPQDNVYQMIRYQLDEDEREIVAIDTGYGENEDEAENLRLMYDIDTGTQRGARFMFKSGSGLLSGVLAPSGAPVFFIPSPLEIDNEDAYNIKNGYFSNDSNYTLLPYGTSDKSVYRLDACVMIDSYQSNKDSALWFLVTDKTEVLSGMETYTEITGYSNKTASTYQTDQRDLFDNVQLGDIIQVETDSRGFAVDYQKVYDAEERDFTEIGKSYLFYENPNAAKRYICADVYDSFNNLISVSNVYIGDGKLQSRSVSDITAADLTEKFNSTLFQNKRGVILYDVRQKKVTVNDLKDLKEYKMYGAECSKIVIMTAYSEAQFMFIFNY